MFLWVMMILGGVWLIQQVDTGGIKPLFEPTPTPTRSVESFLLEGDANFTAGDLNAAIAAYQEAVRQNPNDADTFANLARIQTYSSAFLQAGAQDLFRRLDLDRHGDGAVAAADLGA